MLEDPRPRSDHADDHGISAFRFKSTISQRSHSSKHHPHTRSLLLVHLFHPISFAIPSHPPPTQPTHPSTSTLHPPYPTHTTLSPVVRSVLQPSSRRRDPEDPPKFSRVVTPPQELRASRQGFDSVVGFHQFEDPLALLGGG